MGTTKQHQEQCHPSRHLLVQSQQRKTTLNKFHTLFRCFYCWLRKSKYRQGWRKKVSYFSQYAVPRVYCFKNTALFTKSFLKWNRVAMIRNIGINIQNLMQGRASQLTFTCSKSTIEMLEKGVNIFKVDNKKNHQNDVDVVLVFLLLIWTYFTPFCSASIVDFT